MLPVDPSFYTPVGESGLQVSKVIVGCMSFGKKSWADWVIEDEEEVFKILKYCYDNNMRTFDTADIYSNGYSEILVGKFLKKYNIRRESVVILSKVFFYIDPEDAPNGRFNAPLPPRNAFGLSRKHIFEGVELSVERLGTYMDVLQIHRFDKSVPPKEIMKLLNDVVEKGYARYIGASSMKAYQFATLQFIAEKYDYHKFISMQNYYNLIGREEEREMIEYCNYTGVGLVPYSPNARGILSRNLEANKTKTTRSNSDKIIDKYGLQTLTEADQTIVNRVEELAKKKGVSMTSIATGWVILKGGAPIVGLSSVSRVDDALDAIKLTLSDDEVKYLEEPYVPKPHIIT